MTSQFGYYDMLGRRAEAHRRHRSTLEPPADASDEQSDDAIPSAQDVRRFHNTVLRSFAIGLAYWFAGGVTLVMKLDFLAIILFCCALVAWIVDIEFTRVWLSAKRRRSLADRCLCLCCRYDLRGHRGEPVCPE